MNRDTHGSNGISRWLIHRAAGTAPAALSERLEEEWLADMAARRSPASRLFFALGCCWATRVIAFEHRASSVAVTCAVGAPEGSFATRHPQLGLFSRRTTTLALVACLHLVVFYGFITGLTQGLVSPPPTRLQNTVIPVTPVRESPPLPTPQLNRTKLWVPIPDFSPVHDSTTTADFVPVPETADPVLSSGPPLSLPPAHVVKQLQGGPAAGFPNPDDFYPSLARHLEEQGMAVVRVCVDAQGRLTVDPTVLEGSGSARLDDGALRLARAGSGHYRATTEDGRPVASCYPFRVRFQLKSF